MLRRLNIQVLNNPGNIWPISASLLLHIIFLMLLAMPRAPQMAEFLTVEMKSIPQFSAPASSAKTASAQNSVATAADTAQPQPVAKSAQLSEPVKQVSTSAPSVHKPVPVQTSAQAQSVTSGAHSGATAVKGAAAPAPAKAGPTAPSGPVEGTFGASDGPSFTHAVQPVYPRIARKLGREGTVLLRISLDEKGTLTSVVVVEKAGHGFDEAALNAVRASRFKAAKHRGMPVACRALLPISFRLEE